MESKREKELKNQWLESAKNLAALGEEERGGLSEDLKNEYEFHQRLSRTFKKAYDMPVSISLSLEFFLKLTVPHMKTWPIYTALIFLWITIGFFLEPYLTKDSSLMTLSLLIGVLITALVFPLSLVFYKDNYQAVDDFEKRFLHSIDHFFTSISKKT